MEHLNAFFFNREQTLLYCLMWHLHASSLVKPWMETCTSWDPLGHFLAKGVHSRSTIQSFSSSQCYTQTDLVYDFEAKQDKSRVEIKGIKGKRSESKRILEVSDLNALYFTFNGAFFPLFIVVCGPCGPCLNSLMRKMIIWFFRALQCGDNGIILVHFAIILWLLV